MLPMAVARFSSDRVTKSHGEWTISGIFFPIDNPVYSVAFWTHTKTAEPIEMPFGLMSWLGPGDSVLRVGDDFGREMGNFWGKRAQQA